MFETEIPERRTMKNRRFYIYMCGVYLALSLFHAVFFFCKPTFDRGWNVGGSLIWMLACIKTYRDTIDEPEQTKILDI